jgi:hypothetical protein
VPELPEVAGGVDELPVEEAFALACGVVLVPPLELDGDPLELDGEVVVSLGVVVVVVPLGLVVVPPPLLGEEPPPSCELPPPSPCVSVVVVCVGPLLAGACDGAV